MEPDAQHAVDESLARADSAYHSLQLGDALVEYRAATELAPQSYDAHLGVARTLTRMRERAQALAAADRCIALDAGRYEAYATKAVLHFLGDELEPAEAAAQAAIARAPDEPEPRLTLAQVHCDRQNLVAADQAIAEARRLIEAQPPGTERDELLAMSWHVETYRHLIANDDAAARSAAQRVIEMEDASPYAAALAYSNLGIMETRAKHYDLAIEYLEKAYRTNPHFYRAAGALGHILIIRGQPARAAEILEQVVAHDEGETGDARYAYGVALAKSGRRSEARAQFRRALALGLKGAGRIMAWWQVIWLYNPARYAVIGLGVLLFAAWIVSGQLSQQGITLAVLIVMLLTLQNVLFRKRKG